jgi:hypothetical protein
MKNAVLGLLGVVAVLLIVTIAYVFTIPSHVHVERSSVMNAKAVDIWPYVIDLKRFPEWSPWQNLDPSQTMEFSDPSSGVGAWYTWAGNKDVGKGKMTITGADEAKKLTEDLEFIEPFESHAKVAFTIDEVAAGAKVTWGFDTEMGFMGRAMGIFMNMDSSVGADFARGLDRLDKLAETDAKARTEREKLDAEAAAAKATEEAAAQASEAAPAAP